MIGSTESVAAVKKRRKALEAKSEKVPLSRQKLR